MRVLLEPSASFATPGATEVLGAQGVPEDARVPPRVRDLVNQAFERYTELVAPAVIRTPISLETFEAIYSGEGRNEPWTPLELIYPKASGLALFAVTVGQATCDEIKRLFAANDPALGSMLDAIASVGAEKLARETARQWQGELDGRMSVLPYSPGYCGWHVSGQRKLFAELKPEEIGITLSDSCLMHPLKSVSGVLVAADAEYHEFDIDYPFCTDCSTQECRERIHSLR